MPSGIYIRTDRHRKLISTAKKGRTPKNWASMKKHIPEKKLFKECPKCKEVFPREKFTGRQSGKMYSYCGECMKAVAREYRKNNPAKWRATKRKTNLKRLFGLTVARYDLMYSHQNGVCAVCGNPEPTGKLLAVDHNHVTGVVRGLLCSNCNRALGQFKDSPVILESALNYLRRLNDY